MCRGNGGNYERCNQPWNISLVIERLHEIVLQPARASFDFDFGGLSKANQLSNIEVVIVVVAK